MNNIDQSIIINRFIGIDKNVNFVIKDIDEIPIVKIPYNTVNYFEFDKLMFIQRPEQTIYHRSIIPNEIDFETIKLYLSGGFIIKSVVVIKTNNKIYRVLITDKFN